GARSDASACSPAAGGGIETIRRLAPSRRRQDSKRYVILPLPACGGLEAIRRLAPSPACGGGLGWGQGRSDAAGVASFRHGSVKRPSTPLRYPPAMRLPHRIAAIAALSFLFASAAHAVTVGAVEILGLDEDMTNNVRVSLSLVDAAGQEVSGRRMGYLVRAAEDETREALEPFGFYSPVIEVERSRENGSVSVTIRVDAGEPVRVRNADIAIIGEGGQDRYLQSDLDDFIPSPGAIFNHADYEDSKIRISRRLTERGYFDADFSSRRVEVTRAQNAADIELVWTSGRRYDMGPTRFEQTRPIIRDELLERLVYWDEGDYYHQGRIDRLRTSLARLDYFGDIEIRPEPDAALDGRVPVNVKLTPAKRNIYTAGLSYGTDSGAGVRLGAERRYVNSRGHKALAQLDYAQKRKTLTLQYRIPAFAWRDGWYTISAQG